MGYRINENKTNIVPFQSGSGAPTHLSQLGSVYIDNLTGTQYINKDGLAGWSYMYDSSMPISGGTGSGGTITGAYVPLSGGTMSGTLYAPIFSGGSFYGDGSHLSGVGGSFTGGTVTGNTIFVNGLTANTISATTYFNLPSTSGAYLPLSGGTVYGPAIFTSGVTANTLSQVQWIDFSTATTVTQATGRVFYDVGEQSLAYYPDINQAVTVRIGQQLYVRVNNISGNLIPKGSVVSITGTSNNLPSVTLSKNNHTITSARPIGLAADNIPNNNVGLVITNGILSGITLNNFNNGDTLYLSPFSAGTYVSTTSNFPFSARTNEIGYVIQTGVTTGKIYVNINNEDSNLSLTDIERNILEGNVISTGAYEYTGVTQGTGQTINVAALKGWVVKNTYSYSTLPDVTNIIYSGGTNIPLTYLSSAPATYLLINSGSTLTQQITFPTPQQRRENIFIGKVVHPNNTTITSFNQTVDFDVSPMSALRDLWTPLKLINQGVTVSPHSTTLEINTSSGTLWGNGIGWTTNQLNPDSVYITGQSPVTFQYRTQTGGTFSNVTTLDCTNYDVNGVVTVIPGNNGSQLARATNQRVYLFPTGLIRIQYGQQWYDSLTLAIAGIQNEIFNEFINNRDNGILIGIITVARSTTNLSNSTQAYFSLVSKFGELFGGTAGISTTTLQQAYDNSTNPEIVINSILDGLSIKNGTGNADNVTHLLEGMDAAGQVTSFITADGTFSGRTLYGNISGVTGLSNAQVTSALGYTPYNSTNPNGYISGITSGNVTTALGYTPYNATNPNGYISGITSVITGTGINNTVAIFNSTNSISGTTGFTYNGNLGIGTNAPAVSLDILSTGTVLTGPNNYHMRVFDATTSAKDVGGVIGLGGYFSTTGTSNFGVIKGGKEAANVGENAGYLAFFTRTNGAVLTEQVRITSIGNLLIGSTTDNGNKLQVNGNSNFNGNVTISGNTNISGNTLLSASNTIRWGANSYLGSDGAGTFSMGFSSGGSNGVLNINNISSLTFLSGGFASGTNAAGTNMVIQPRDGTGTGTTGNIIFNISKKGTSGSAAQLYVQAMTIFGDTGSVGIGQLPTPTAPTGVFVVTGGTLTAATYYYSIVAVDGLNNTTVQSINTSVVTTGSTGLVNLTWTGVTGAYSYRIYQGLVASGQTQYLTSTTTSVTDNGSGYTTGSALPTTNTTAMNYISSGTTNNFNGVTLGYGSGGINSNTVLGYQAFTGNTTGGFNVAIGTNTILKANTNYNTAIGYGALQNTTTGNNTAVGFNALQTQTTGQYNTAVGTTALQNINGNGNSAFGLNAFNKLSTGANNVALGMSAGFYYGGAVNFLTTLNNSIMIGFGAAAGANSDTNEIVIGYNAIGAGSNTTTIGNTGTTGTTIYGKLTIGSGSRATVGQVTLTGGTATVTNANVATTSLIFLTCKTVDGIQGLLSYSSSTGTFTITSSSMTDTSTINWWIIN